MYNKDIFFEKISKFSDSDKGLAALFGVSPGNINDWKRGRSKPNIDALVKIADATNTTTDYLLGREEKQDKLPCSSWHGGKDEIKKDSLALNYGESPTKYKIKELVDTILEQNNNEEELNALKIVLEKFIK